MKDRDIKTGKRLMGVSLIVSYLETKFFQALENLLIQSSFQMIIRICFGMSSTW